MADDMDDFILFIDFLYDHAERSDRIVMERADPFEDFDEKKFLERFRLSKATVQQLLIQVSSQVSSRSADSR